MREIKPKPPCTQDCEKRKPGCRSVCEPFIKYDKERLDYYKVRQENKEQIRRLFIERSQK